MTKKCNLHPGRDAVAQFLGKDYCQICKDGMDKARKMIDKHVEPKECFIWYVGHDTWEPIPGTGCAHYVSHQQGIKIGTDGAKCLAGYTFRVPTVVRARKKLKGPAEVKVNDIWASPSLDHMGMVIRVIPPTPNAPNPSITIRHDSSRQGRVAEDKWEVYFHSAGSFYR